MSREKLATVEEVAEYLGVSTGTVYNWRYSGAGPRALKAGGRVRYRWEDVDRWLEERTRLSA